MATSNAKAYGKAFGGLLVVLIVLYVVVLIVFKFTWDILVPDLFPGAVEQGLVARTISWWTVLSLAGAVTLVSYFVRWISTSAFGSAAQQIPVLGAKINAIAAHLGIDLDAALQAEVATLARAGKKIQAIALYRGYNGKDLASAKAFVDGLLQGTPPTI